MAQLQIYNHNQWTNIELGDLHKGDIFRMLNKDNKPVKDDKGSLAWQCTCNAFYNEECERCCVNTKDMRIEDI